MPWPKGVSGNPGGKPPECIEVKEVRRLAQAKTHEAFKIVVALMENEGARETTRLAAALSVLKIAGMRFDSPPEQDQERAVNALPQNYSKAQLMAAAKGDA